MATHSSNIVREYQLFLTLSYAAPEIANNRTSTTARLYLVNGENRFDTNSTGSLVIDGVTRWSLAGNLEIPSLNSETTLWSGTFWVDHNLDGSKTLPFSASLQNNSNLGGWALYPAVSLSGSETLPTIARGPYVDNGSAFVSSVAYVDNGSAFVPAITYVDTGTEWKVVG